jgi:hypothetical protein
VVDEFIFHGAVYYVIEPENFVPPFVFGDGDFLELRGFVEKWFLGPDKNIGVGDWLRLRDTEFARLLRLPLLAMISDVDFLRLQMLTYTVESSLHFDVPLSAEKVSTGVTLFWEQVDTQPAPRHHNHEAFLTFSHFDKSSTRYKHGFLQMLFGQLSTSLEELSHHVVVKSTLHIYK